MMLDASYGLKKLSAENVSQALTVNESTFNTSASSFARSESSVELIEHLKTAMKQKDFTQVESVLATLQAYGPEAYRQGFAVYSQLLNDPKAFDIKTSQCKSQRKTASSIHMICGHTNLPVNKVYQDKNGECQLLYRQNLVEKPNMALEALRVASSI